MCTPPLGAEAEAQSKHGVATGSQLSFHPAFRSSLHLKVCCSICEYVRWQITKITQMSSSIAGQDGNGIRRLWSVEQSLGGDSFIHTIEPGHNVHGANLALVQPGTGNYSGPDDVQRLGSGRVQPFETGFNYLQLLMRKHRSILS
jgi:hypothetical protein